MYPTLQRLLGSALCALVLSPVAAPAHAQEGAASVIQSLRTRLAQDVDQIELDPTRLTTRSVVERLPQATPQAACTWVRDNIAFDPYLGNLRGSRGALFSQGGNSLDRALLLGGLLDEMGVSWRLVRGDLDDATQIALLSRATGEGRWSGGIVPASARTFDPATDMRHRNAIRSHYWVRAQTRGGEVDLDSSLPGLSPGETLATAIDTFEPGQLPRDVEQTVQITVHYSTSGTDGGRVLNWSGPASEVAYRNITLSFRANESRRQIEPLLQVQDSAIRGSTIQAGGLERVWMEVYLRLGAVDQRMERELYSRTGARDVFRADDAVTSIVILPGFVGPDYQAGVTFLLLSDVAERAQRLQQLLDGEAAAQQDSTRVPDALRAESTELLGRSLGLTALAFAALSDRASLQLATRLGVRPFYERPRVILASAQRRGDALMFDLDLRANSLDSLAWAGVPSTAVHAFNVVRGRMDARLAQLVLAGLSGGEAFGTLDVFRAVREAGGSLRTIHSGNVSRLAQTSYSAAAQARLQSEVTGSGFVAFTPSAPAQVGGIEVLHWWRFEPATAHLVGVSELGMNDAWTSVADASAGPGTAERVIARVGRVYRDAADFAISVAAQSSDGREAYCDAFCDLGVLRQSVCSDAPGPVLATCLTGTVVRGGDVLQLSRTCGSQVQPFSCGVEALQAMQGGQLRLDAVRVPSTAPWDRVTAGAIGSCSCR